MVAMYTIAGRQVGSHVLAMATLGVTIGGAFLATSGGKKTDEPKTPAINAKSKEEESFVKEYINKAAEKVQGK